MTGLVNSLMENFYIPPIILNGKETRVIEGDRSTTKTIYVCVDGKQRLSSVRAFIKGMVPCHDHRGEKWWFSNDAGKRRNVLPEATQRTFLNKDFVAYQFEELSQEQEEDLFARVQMGMTLSAAEKMRASSGPWQELARLFVEDFPTVYDLMKDRARAKDFQLTLSCFSQIVEVMHPSASNGVPIMKTNHSALPKFLSNKGIVDDGIKSHLASVWNTFEELIALEPDTFTNANKYLGGVQTFAPVEMVAVTVLISMYSDTRNNRLLLGDIRALREELRKHFVDLRLNLPTWKFLWEYLDDLEGIRGAVDGSTISRPRMDPILAYSPAAVPPPTVTSAGSTGAKDVARRGGPLMVPASTAAPNATPTAASKRKSATEGSSRNKVAAPVLQPVDGEITSGIATSPSLIRSPKRQRTGHGPSLSMPGQITGDSTIQSSRADATVHFPQDMMSPTDVEQSLFVPEATPENNMVLSQRPMILQTTPIQQGERDTHGTCVLSIGSSQRLPSKPPLPSQVRHDRVSELHGYRTSASTPPAYGRSYGVVASPQPPGAAPYNSPYTKIGVGAYVPRNIEDQWEDIIARSTSPQVTPSTSSAPPRTQDKLKSTGRMPAQIRETIDLTEDTAIELVEPDLVERERQNLLSSFKGRSTASKQPQRSAAPAVAPPSATMVRPSLVESGTNREDALPMLNNPYARFKNQSLGHS
ncbi:hypothetical protein NX059_008395 [Plenodomus lindquistii]|nr:hypothetical protein NX059_008395 [Plenodomus lindquistii]